MASEEEIEESIKRSKDLMAQMDQLLKESKLIQEKSSNVFKQWGLSEESVGRYLDTVKLTPAEQQQVDAKLNDLMQKDKEEALRAKVAVKHKKQVGPRRRSKKLRRMI